MTRALLAAAAAAHAVLMFREGQWLSSGVTATRLLFCLASLGVYAACAWRSSKVAVWRSLAPAVVGLGVILWALCVTRGDQRGVVFVLVVPLQWFAAAACLLGPETSGTSTLK